MRRGGVSEDEGRAEFRRVLPQHGRRMLRYGYAVAGDHTEAQDLVQEAFARAWRQWGKLAAHPAPEAWLRVVVARLAADRWRRLHGWRTAMSRTGPPDPVPPPSEDTAPLDGGCADARAERHAGRLREQSRPTAGHPDVDPRPGVLHPAAGERHRYHAGLQRGRGAAAALRRPLPQRLLDHPAPGPEPGLPPALGPRGVRPGRQLPAQHHHLPPRTGGELDAGAAPGGAGLPGAADRGGYDLPAAAAERGRLRRRVGAVRTAGAAPRRHGDPAGADEIRLVRAIRIGDVVTVLWEQGWEGTSSPRSQVDADSRRATAAIEKWLG